MQQHIEHSKRNSLTEMTGLSAKSKISNTVLLVCLIVAVCVAVALTHWPALSAEAMCFDDQAYLSENFLVQNPGWASASRFLTETLEPSTVRGYYQPLTMISLMLDYALGGRQENLMPFHRTSLVLHIANSALIVVLLYILFGRIWIAAAVGLLFGLHPMTVESIPWVAERKTLLAAFFSLVCLILYVHYARKRNWKLYAGCIIMYFLALISKPTSTPLPAMLLLMDYWPLRRLTKRSLLEKVPLFILAFVFSIITYISQSRTAGTVLPSQYGLWRIPLTLCHNIIFYLYKIVWPANLTSHYAFPEPFNLSNPAILAGVVGTVILIVLLLVSLWFTRAVLTSWLIFFVAIFPTMGVIRFSNVIASDKFAYLPSVGLLMLLASVLCWLFRRGWAGKFNVRLIAAAIAVLVLAGAEACATRRYLSYWRDTETLCRYMLTHSPDSPSVLISLGFEMQSQRRLDEAIEHYQKALRIMPIFAKAHFNLGNVLLEKGKITEALDHYYMTLFLQPNHIKANDNIGSVLLSQGKIDAAVSHYRKAIIIRPESFKAHINLGYALQSQGRVDEAIDHYRYALKIKHDQPNAHNNLGNALLSQGKINEAISHYRQALESKPDFADARYNLARALHSEGKFKQAVGHYLKLLQLNPDDIEALNNLAVAFVSLGKPEQALEQFHKLLQIKSDDATIYNNIAYVLISQGKLTEARDYYNKALQIDPNHIQAKQGLQSLLNKKLAP